MKKFFLCIAWALFGATFSTLAAEPLAPLITNISLTGTQKVIKFTLFPAAKSYHILSTTNLNSAFVTNNGSITGFTWTGTSSVPANFYQLKVTPLSSNELLTANVLNRLAYGPTPDEIERILTGPGAIGPDAYITEQLAPELITETVSDSHTNIDIIAAKFAAPTDVIPMNTASYATISDFRAWHVLRAVGAKRQLLEILLQFFENHFVTQYEKSLDYFDPFYDGGTNEQRIAAQFEYLENDKWRTALLSPTCTFYDLLKISAESPAQIIYLDTVTSKGNASNIANENYARELLELFTFGVDNGYIQNDITAMSRSWTGWTIDIVHPTNAFNPFAARLTNKINEASASVVSNFAGVWAFNYKSASHDTTRVKTMFTNAFIPARFGTPYTTKLYGTNTVPGRYTFGVPARTGTNSIQDGYDVIAYLADMPFTQEYISVKLCRLFVHDGFPNPSNDPNSPDYSFYNYAGGNLTPEAQLVRDCMTAWENSSPKGQIRPVLATIFASELFRSHGGSLHKIKTPLEYTVSAVRALRSSTNGTFQANSFSADTDGYDLIGTTGPIPRMGDMRLFDRAEPNGYAEDGAPWISAGTLNERIRFVQAFMMITGQPNYTNTVKDDAGRDTLCFPSVLLTNNLPVINHKNAGAVADYFLGIIFPGEGAGNLNQYRTMAIDFLNNGSADPTPGSITFANLTFSTASNQAYDIRVRGMVGLLLSLQRFHEQ
jgi:uncharacterized protein (DUF1800 family)